MGRPIQKVLFIEPRSPRPHIFSRVAIPRLGSLLLGTILQHQGMEVKVVIEEMAQPDYRNLDFQPDLVCISMHLLHRPPGLRAGGLLPGAGLPGGPGRGAPELSARGRPGARRLRGLRRG